MSDSVMGGQSVATLTTHKNSLTIDTTITKPTSFGAWAGAEIKFSSPADASTFKGIRLTYKGSTTPFAMSVYHSDVRDWDHFSVLLKPRDEWTTLDIPFTTFKQFGFGSPVTWSATELTGVNLMWRKMPGASNEPLKNTLQIKELTYF